MPRATYKRIEKEYPVPGLEGGTVRLRRLSHGEKLERMDEAMHFESGDGDAASTKVFVSTARSRLYDFEHCIVRHNLTDENDRPLDFANPEDVRALDGAIGDAIAKLISEHNDSLEEADQKEGDIPNS